METVPARPEPGIPRWLSRGGSIGWRFLVLAGVVVVLGTVLSKLRLVVVPVTAALFLSTVLVPPARWLRRRGWPPLVATWTVFLGGLALVVGVALWLVPTIVQEAGALGNAVRDGFDQVKNWLIHGPLHLSRHQLDQFLADARNAFGGSGGKILRGAVSGATIAIEVVAAVLLTLVLTFFFVKDGEDIVAWALDLAGPAREEELRAIGARTWQTLAGYIRGTAVNGLVNAVLMSIGLLILGVPLVAAIAVLTFVGGFLPVIGAIVSGAVAALVALVSNGPVGAAVVVGLTVLIHHVEGYLVGPIVLGRAVRLHPVVIMLALTAGTIIAGIIGAFLAVPTTAAGLSVIDYYLERSRRTRLAVAESAPRPEPRAGTGDGGEPGVQAAPAPPANAG